MRGHLGTILGGLFAGLVVSAFLPASAVEPIKIGFGMGLTGGLAASGKAAVIGDEDLGRRDQRRGRAVGSPGQADLLRRPEQPGDGAGDLHQASRRRQGRSRGRRLRHQSPGAGDADRHRAQHDVPRAVRARRQPRVPLPEVLHDGADRRTVAVAQHLGTVLQGGGGAEAEAEDAWRSSPPMPNFRTTPPTARG